MYASTSLHSAMNAQDLTGMAVYKTGCRLSVCALPVRQAVQGLHGGMSMSPSVSWHTCKVVIIVIKDEHVAVLYRLAAKLTPHKLVGRKKLRPCHRWTCARLASACAVV